MNLLPVEESVYLSFRLHNDLGAGVDYMQVGKLIMVLGMKREKVSLHGCFARERYHHCRP